MPELWRGKQQKLKRRSGAQPTIGFENTLFVINFKKEK